MDRGDKVNITYETLFDILRNEKNRPELQKLSKTFFEDLVKYLQEKKEIAEGQKEGIFAEEEREKTVSQLMNIKKILSDLYAKREKKIIELALDKSRIQSEVNLSLLLNEEKIMFEELVKLFDKYKNSVLLKILDGSLPSFEEKKIAEIKEREIIKMPEKKEEHAIDTIEPDIKMVRFIYAVPRFLGKELETYGPFEEEDITTLPVEIANILIAKGRAEEIKQE